MHCKDISVRDVDFPLTPEAIGDAMRDWTAYRRAEHAVLRNGSDHAVVRLVKRDDGSLFEKVDSFEIVSLPEDTVFIERPGTDVLNMTAMARIQEEFPGRTVVVRGLFSHVSFVKDLVPIHMDVVDIVPPRPSKLRHLVDLALATGYVSAPVIPDYREIDIEEAAKAAETSEVMFPCAVSGASAGGGCCYLDQVPVIEGRDITLVGCTLSARIFSEHYGTAVPFINVCPRNAVSEDGRKPTLVKCCRIREGHTLEGNVASVPWGVTVPEIVDAINDLVGSACGPR